MNIIFLDIDGVLNHELFFEKRFNKKKKSRLKTPLENIDIEKVQLLNDLCKEIDAKVVISSTWRYSGLDYCKKVLTQAGATFDIIDITPKLHFNGAVRGNEIYLWIKENTLLLGVSYYNFKTYVILDDDSDMLYWQRNNFFHCDPYCGLTPNICYKIKCFLK